ncbi:MAG: putative histidine kinase, atypical hybrid [Gammaproteobacteria bacterium]|nr:putative histidine kinase, atypical hybrid [Gammaproteobacteria bacterium]
MHVFKSPPASRKQSRRPPKIQSTRPAKDDNAKEHSEVKLNGETSAILAALIALKRGNSDVRLPEEWPGQAGRIAEAFNEVVELNVRTARELERLNQVVGREGKLRHRASLGNVSGFWYDSIENINALIDDLVHPTTEVARVIGAFAQGDLTKTMALEIESRPLEGEFRRTAKTINKMIEQLSSFATEVTRVAREVGTEGILGGQARVEGVSGTWKDLTESVNFMAGNLTGQVRNIAEVTKAVAAGDLSKKVTVDVKGEILELKNTVNTMVDQLRSFASEVTRVAREVGTEGILGGQADVKGVSGTWKDLTESVNFMAGNLTGQVRNIAEVTTAVAAGDLSKKITVDVKGEIEELKDTINTMVDQLRSFAAEVTRVAREVGTEGSLGGQAQVEGVSGTWKDLTDNVNLMASNLTSQVRGIAKVVTAVANGDLDLKLKVDAKGEIAALAETINSMTETLATFADQVTSVAREVGVEGKLGGQAKVPGAAGTWKGLTENVNQLAANLTTQVRAIAEVAMAVTKGDLTRSITVQAEGEVAALKDTINEMIRNLKDTTQKNTEQDWRKTNLAKFSRMLQGQKDLVAVGRMILSELAPVVGAQQAEFYVLDSVRATPKLQLLASYASGGQGAHGKELSLGEGLVGQCAVDKQQILMQDVPADALRISSGLALCSPQNILVLPVVFEGQVKGVLELASFERFSSTHQAFLDQLTESIGVVINTIEANMRTENLLQQSQSLAQELQQTNQELQEKAQLLAHQNHEVERKNSEVEQARQALEEKAKQLALTSKYKSEFLANMSHELRTPLNSLLILSDQLSRNSDGNLTPRQVEFARTIHSAGNDLLMLINDILDLSKIESGTVVVDVGELRFKELQHYVERNFRHVAEAKTVGFVVILGEQLPSSMVTDAKRLQQILKNLLSNAFKVTHRGQVTLTIDRADVGWGPENEELERAHEVLAFSVNDSGIGISADKQQIIFEAFQQADGSTSRKYGGTGLGLAISRELSKLLGGEIRLVSAPGKGSIFTLYLPQTYIGSRSTRQRTPAEIAAQKPPSAVLDEIFQDGPARLPSMAAPAEREEEHEQESLASNEAQDDRESIQPGDKVLLIVENDLAFARLLLEGAREKGFKGLVTTRGSGALTLSRDFEPDAVTLDLFLPDMNGWRVLNRLKNHLATRHIPVCVISTDEARAQALEAGAAGFIAKPLQSKDLLDRALEELHQFVTRPTRHLLILMPESNERDEIVAMLSGIDVRIFPVANATLACSILQEQPIDCLVVGPGAPALDLQACEPLLVDDGTGLGQPGVVFYGAGRFEAGYEDFRRRFKDRITIRESQSRERLLEQTALFLHRDLNALTQSARCQLEALHEAQKALAGRKVLIVDDDMRNIFALATVLDEQGMTVISADNGREAIQHVLQDSSIDVVLMDIMMPEMDGIATIQEIRKIPERHELPIIAVTAKAMKGDREKCIAAGAWDYLSKPVNTQDLLAALRAWLKA